MSKGFTLIEMLVVVTILVMLVMMILPAVTRTTQFAELRICGSNLQKLTHGALMYTGANNQRLPFYRQWVANGYNWDQSTDHIRNGLIWKYVCNVDVYVCPTFVKVSHTRPYRSYSQNWNLGNRNGDGNDFYPQEDISLMQHVRDVTNMLLLSEESPWITPGCSRYTLNDGSLVAENWPGRDTIATYHLPPGGDLYLGTGNCSFLDGHVERVETHETKPLCLDSQ